MERKKHVELYLLLQLLKPSDILKKFPEYSISTVYKYSKELKLAKKKVRELLTQM